MEGQVGGLEEQLIT
jgi:hypothetical protein